MSFWPRRVRQRTGGDGSNQMAGRDLHNTYIAGPPGGESVGPTGLQTILERFVQIYEWHRIHRAEIPAFVKHCGGPSMTLHDVTSDETLARRLDEELLEFTTQLFVLYEDYLWHIPARRIFPTQHFYKAPQYLPRLFLIEAVVRDRDESGKPARLWVDEDLHPADGYGAGSLYVLASSVPPRVLTEDGAPDPWDDSLVGFVFRVQFTTFRGREIFRYYPFEVEPYCYWKVRYDVLSVIAVAHWCQVNVRGRIAEAHHDDRQYIQGTLVDICRGERFPFELTGFDPYVTDNGDLKSWPIDSLLRVDEPSAWAAEDWANYVDWSRPDGSLKKAVEEAKTERRRLFLAEAESGDAEGGKGLSR